MAKNYKTPGIYVEEIQGLPRSVAQVETAIPAFIGYTEKASDKVIGDLEKIPKRITSTLEYMEYFGSAKPETSIKINIYDQLSNVGFERTIKTRDNKFKLETAGWGTFKIYVQIKFKDGTVLELEHDLELYKPAGE